MDGVKVGDPCLIHPGRLVSWTKDDGSDGWCPECMYLDVAIGISEAPPMEPPDEDFTNTARRLEELIHETNHHTLHTGCSLCERRRRGA